MPMTLFFIWKQCHFCLITAILIDKKRGQERKKAVSFMSCLTQCDECEMASLFFLDNLNIWRWNVDFKRIMWESWERKEKKEVNWARKQIQHSFMHLSNSLITTNLVQSFCVIVIRISSQPFPNKEWSAIRHSLLNASVLCFTVFTF